MMLDCRRCLPPGDAAGQLQQLHQSGRGRGGRHEEAGRAVGQLRPPPAGEWASTRWVSARPSMIPVHIARVTAERQGSGCFLAMLGMFPGHTMFACEAWQISWAKNTKTKQGPMSPADAVHLANYCFTNMVVEFERVGCRRRGCWTSGATTARCTPRSCTSSCATWCGPPRRTTCT